MKNNNTNLMAQNAKDTKYDYYRKELPIISENEKIVDSYEKIFQMRKALKITNYIYDIEIAKDSFKEISKMSGNEIDEYILFTFYKLIDKIEFEKIKSENIKKLPLKNQIQEKEENNIEKLENKPVIILDSVNTNKDKKQKEEKIEKMEENKESTGVDMNFSIEGKQFDNLNEDKLLLICPWLFLLLTPCGVFNLLYFIIGLVQAERKINFLNFYTLFVMFGLLEFTGIYGFYNTFANDYSNKLIFGSTILSAICSLLSFIIALIIFGKFLLDNDPWLTVGVNFTSFLLSVLLIILVELIKKRIEKRKMKEEALLDNEDII